MDYAYAPILKTWFFLGLTPVCSDTTALGKSSFTVRLQILR